MIGNTNVKTNMNPNVNPIVNPIVNPNVNPNVKTNMNSNLISQLKTPVISVFIILVCIVLILITLIVLFNHGIKTTPDGKISKSNHYIIFSTIIFTLLIFTILFTLLPNLKSLKTFIGQMKNVFFVVAYTIFLILFFRMLPTKTLNDYGFILGPFTVLISAYLFYNGLNTNYLSDHGIIYEKMKIMVLFFCLITTFIIYYLVDPGGFIKKYFGYVSLLSILISVFSFLYVILVFTRQTKTLKDGSFFNSISSILIFLFFVFLFAGIYIYPGGLFSDPSASSLVIVFSLLVILLYSFISIVNSKNTEALFASNILLYKKSLFYLFGVIIIGLVISWICINTQRLSGNTFINILLNILLLFLVILILYRIMNVNLPNRNTNSQKNGFFEIIINSALFIPCALYDLFSATVKFASHEYNNTNQTSLYALAFAISLFIIYFIVLYVKNQVFLQGGKILVKFPINTDTLHSIAPYKELNNNEDFNYHYGISFWLYIDSFPPSTNYSYDKYTSVLNYGNKPNILYKASDNTMIITMPKSSSTNAELEYIDEYIDEIIIYKLENVLLQKWNHIVLNFNNGTLDVFYNNQLVKSVNEIVPYMSLDTLKVGSPNGIKAGISNLIYFKNPLTAINIYYLYNSVKNKNTLGE